LLIVPIIQLSYCSFYLLVISKILSTFFNIFLSQYVNEL
jgi:hypothetical protein